MEHTGQMISVTLLAHLKPFTAKDRETSIADETYMANAIGKVGNGWALIKTDAGKFKCEGILDIPEKDGEVWLGYQTDEFDTEVQAVETLVRFLTPGTVIEDERLRFEWQIVQNDHGLYGTRMQLCGRLVRTTAVCSSVDEVLEAIWQAERTNYLDDNFWNREAQREFVLANMDSLRAAKVPDLEPLSEFDVLDLLTGQYHEDLLTAVVNGDANVKLLGKREGWLYYTLQDGTYSAMGIDHEYSDGANSMPCYRTLDAVMTAKVAYDHSLQVLSQEKLDELKADELAGDELAGDDFPWKIIGGCIDDDWFVLQNSDGQYFAYNTLTNWQSEEHASIDDLKKDLERIQEIKLHGTDPQVLKPAQLIDPETGTAWERPEGYKGAPTKYGYVYYKGQSGFYGMVDASFDSVYFLTPSFATHAELDAHCKAKWEAWQAEHEQDTKDFQAKWAAIQAEEAQRTRIE